MFERELQVYTVVKQVSGVSRASLSANHSLKSQWQEDGRDYICTTRPRTETWINCVAGSHEVMMWMEEMEREGRRS